VPKRAMCTKAWANIWRQRQRQILPWAVGFVLVIQVPHQEVERHPSHPEPGAPVVGLSLLAVLPVILKAGRGARRHLQACEHIHVDDHRGDVRDLALRKVFG
jgi:hypothetical protein